MVFVRRPALERFLKKRGRRLLYGRRKTGKTYYTRRTLSGYDYFIVRPGGVFLDPAGHAEYGLKEFIGVCRRADKLVIDEFHRAPSGLFDYLHSGECGEEIVLLTSTLHYHKKFTQSPGAPLKGMFTSMMLGLISPLDLLRVEWEIPEPKELVEHLVFYQEPVLIDRDLTDVIAYGHDIAKSLVSEILVEEDYDVTIRYHSILEAVASGKTRISEIASHLYSRGLLPSQDTGLVSKYLAIMTRIGLLEKIPVYGKKRRGLYRHVSPLTHTSYYLNAKYGVWETPTSPEFQVRAADNLIPMLVEVFVERLLSSYYGLRPVKILEPEVDVALVSMKTVKVVAEVKWRKNITRKHVRGAEEKLSKFPDAEKMLVVPDASLVPETWLNVLDVEKMAEMAREA